MLWSVQYHRVVDLEKYPSGSALREKPDSHFGLKNRYALINLLLFSKYYSKIRIVLKIHNIGILLVFVTGRVARKIIVLYVFGYGYKFRPDPGPTKLPRSGSATLYILLRCLHQHHYFSHNSVVANPLKIFVKKA